MAKRDDTTAKRFIDIAFKAQEADWFKRAKRLQDFYNGKYYKTKENRNRFTVNSIFAIVNLIIPNFIFNNPYIRTKPTNAKYFKKLSDGEYQMVNTIRAGRIREAAINHDFTHINAIAEHKKAVQDALFFGFGITKTGYSYETTSVLDQDYVLKDQIFVKRVNPKDFGWHPFATSLEDSVMTVHRTLTTKKKLKDSGKYKDAVLEKVKCEIPDHFKDRYSLSTKEAEEFADFVTLYEVRDFENDLLYEFAGESKVLLEKKKFPYHFNGSEFSMIKFAGDNDCFEGFPLLGSIEDEAIALNEVMTLIVEHMRKFPGQVFANNGSIDTDDLDRIRNGEQGSVHLVNDINQLLFKPPMAMGGEYFNIVNLLQSIMDKVVGVPDFSRMGGSSRKSATESSFIQGDVTIRREYYMKEVKKFILQDVRKIAALQEQFQDEEKETKASGELQGEIFKWDKTDIQGDFVYDFEIDDMRYMNEAQMNALNNSMNILGAHEIYKPIIQTMDPFKLGRTIFKLMGLNIEAFQTEEPENAIITSPSRENEIALSGDPMPAPKKGEDHKGHLESHESLVQDIINQVGPEQARRIPGIQQIIEHIAETKMLMQKEGGIVPKPAQPQAVPPPMSPQGANPQGPVGPMQQMPTQTVQ